jgi:hypothetical protein
MVTRHRSYGRVTNIDRIAEYMHSSIDINQSFVHSSTTTTSENPLTNNFVYNIRVRVCECRGYFEAISIVT